MLGGSGNRTSKGVDLVLTPAKFQKKYLYEASCGTEIRLSSKMHNQVQLGATRTLRKSKGEIAAHHLVRVITVTEQKDEIKRKQAELAERHARPYLLVDLAAPLPVADVLTWLDAHRPAALNVAGPRESQPPDIASQATEFLASILRGRGD